MGVLACGSLGFVGRYTVVTNSRWRPGLACTGLLLAMAAGGLPGRFPTPTPVEASTKPNIVVIMVDDLDSRSLQTLLSQGMMPHLQARVIGNGRSLSFTESFVTRPICCPSRATFFTGQYAHNHGVLTNDPPNGSVANFRDNSTIATWLKAAGYRTGLVGKYLNGYGSLTSQSYIPPGWDDWQGLLDFSSSRPYFFNVNDNGVVAQHTTFNTDVMAQRAVSFIEEASPGQPFFLYVAPSAPHLSINPQFNACPAAGASPWEFNPVLLEQLSWGYTVFPAPRHQGLIYGNTTRFALPRPPSFNEDVSDKPAWYRNAPMSAANIDCLQKNYWRRLESLLGIDELVGSVDLALSQKQVRSNTIVIFTSDNGFMLGEHRQLHKGQAFEESIRVPLIIGYPGTGGARTINHLVLNNDLAPTIAALAGATPGHTVDGRSLLPLFAPAAPAVWRKRFVVEHWSNVPSTNALDFFALRSGAGSTARKLVDYPRAAGETTKEFYKLGVDPYELTNVQGEASVQSEIAELMVRLNQLKICAGISCRSLEDAP